MLILQKQRKEGETGGQCSKSMRVSHASPWGGLTLSTGREGTTRMAAGSAQIALKCLIKHWTERGGQTYILHDLRE